MSILILLLALVDPPIIFGEGVISTNDDEFGGTFTPDGNTVFYSKAVLRFYVDVICYSELKNGKMAGAKSRSILRSIS